MTDAVLACKFDDGIEQPGSNALSLQERRNGDRAEQGAWAPKLEAGTTHDDSLLGGDDEMIQVRRGAVPRQCIVIEQRADSPPVVRHCPTNLE